MSDKPTQHTLIHAWLWNFAWTARHGWLQQDSFLLVTGADLAQAAKPHMGHRVQSELATLAATYVFSRQPRMMLDAVAIFQRFWQLSPCLTQEDWDFALTIFRKYYATH